MHGISRLGYFVRCEPRSRYRMVGTWKVAAPTHAHMHRDHWSAAQLSAPVN